MPQPLFSVSEQIFERFPDYIVGYVIADIESNNGPCAGIDALLRDAEERAQIVYAGQDLKEDPAIAVWRRAFSQLGWSASKFPSSVEALVKRAARRMALPGINPAVNLANAAALHYVVPVGCHDRDLSPGLEVRFATDNDRFVPMGDGDAEHPGDGEIIYASARTVRTRRWVWRQSRDGLVTDESIRIFVPIDGFDDVTRSRVEAAINFVDLTLVEQLGASVITGIVTRGNPAVSES